MPGALGLGAAGGGGFQGSSAAQSGGDTATNSAGARVFNFGGAGTSNIQIFTLIGAAVFIAYLFKGR